MMSTVKRSKLSIPSDPHDYEREVESCQAMTKVFQAMAVKQDWDLLVADMASAGSLVPHAVALHCLLMVRDKIATQFAPEVVESVFGDMDDPSIERLLPKSDR